MLSQANNGVSIGQSGLERFIWMSRKPGSQAGQGERKLSLGGGTVQGSVRRTRRAGISPQRRGFMARLQFGTSRGQRFADLQPGQPFRPCDVEQSGDAAVQQFPSRPGGDDGRNWAAEFVHKEFRHFAGLPVAAELLIEPAVAARRRAAIERGADDRVAGICEHDLFGGDFGFGVNTQRADRVGLDVVSLFTVKDQVGGEKDERNIQRKFGEQGGGFDIDFSGKAWVRLTFGAFAHGGAVDDGSGLSVTEQLAHGVEVSEIQVNTSKAARLPEWCKLWCGGDEVIADQSAGACDPGKRLGLE